MFAFTLQNVMPLKRGKFISFQLRFPDIPFSWKINSHFFPLLLSRENQPWLITVVLRKRYTSCLSFCWGRQSYPRGLVLPLCRHICLLALYSLDVEPFHASHCIPQPCLLVPHAASHIFSFLCCQ